MKTPRTYLLIVVALLVGISSQACADPGPMVVEMTRAMVSGVWILTAVSLLSITLEVAVVLAFTEFLRLRTWSVLWRVLLINVVTFIGSAFTQLLLGSLVPVALAIVLIEILVVVIEAESYLRLLIRPACRTLDSKDLSRTRAYLISLAGNVASAGAGLYLMLLYT